MPEEILELADQWNQMPVILRAILANVGIRTREAKARHEAQASLLSKGPKPADHPLPIVYYSMYLYVSLRRQQFENQQQLWKLLSAKQCRDRMKPFKICYQPGISTRPLEEVAPRRFRIAPKKRHRTVSVGDGTRISRIGELLHHAGQQPIIVGEMGHPDISLRKEGGHPVSQRAEAIVEYIQSVRRRQLLSAEVYTEILWCITAKNIPLLVYNIWLESNKGFCGFLMVKMWLRYVQLYHKYDIDCIGWVTDACGQGVWGGEYIMTPNEFFIHRGCGYLGLPSKTFRYFHIFLRPRQSSGRVPPPLGHHGEASHQARKGRSNIDSDSTEWVWQIITSNGRTVHKVVSLTKLNDLARNKSIKLGFSIKDIVNYNKVIDQKNDAAWHLISMPLISLLELEHGTDDAATVLVLKAMNWNLTPWKIPMTNPREVVYRVWRGWAILKMNEIYVSDLHKLQKDKYLPSNQFRTTYEKMTCSATVRVLEHYLLGVGQDGLTWADFHLEKCNGDPIEGLHGEGRQYFGNDVNFSGAGWCRIMTRLQVQAEMKALLQAYGMEFAVPRHNAKTWTDKIELGCPEPHREHLLLIGEDSYSPPDTYSEFVQDMMAAREEAIVDGMKDFGHSLPDAMKELVDADLWGSFPEYEYLEWEDEDKVCLPTCLQDIATPDAIIEPDDLVIPESKLKAMRDFEKQVAEAEAKDGDDEANHAAAVASDEEETPDEQARIDALAQQARADYAALHSVDCKWSMRTANGVDIAQLKQGTHCLGPDEALLSVHTLLKAEQRREVICKDRAKRFWVGILRDWAIAVAEGHNVTYGSILLVHSTAKGFFAVARVMRMHVDGERNHSCFLPDQVTKRRKLNIKFRTELLIPSGDPTEHGSQRYKASGQYLPLLNASMVVCRVELMKMDYLNKVRGAFCNDALLLCEDISTQQQKGMLQLGVDDCTAILDPNSGYADEYTGEWFEDSKLGDVKCTMCCSAWFDSSTGLVVRCTSCEYSYHQSCVPEKIKMEDIPSWKCSVCTGVDQDLCRKCGREWTMHGKAKAKDNDELVWCEGGCDSWYHQNCHDPPIRPIPKGKFVCSECTQELTAEHDAQEEEENQPPPPPRRRARKKTQPEPRQKSQRMKDSNMDQPGIHNLNKNLPKRLPGGRNEGSRLDQMAWDHPVAPPGSKKGKKGKPKQRSRSPSTSSSESEAAAASPPPPEQPTAQATGKRIRKQTQTYDVNKDGANDTQRKKQGS